MRIIVCLGVVCQRTPVFSFVGGFVSAFLYALNSADAMRVDGGPLIDDFHYDVDDKIVTFRWGGDKGGFEVVVPPESAAKARRQKNGFVVADLSGEAVTVEMYKVEPKYPLPPLVASDWMQIFCKADAEGVAHFDVMKSVMDSVVDTFIGGHAGRLANDQGYLCQIEALYSACDGDLKPIVCGLSRRLSGITAFEKAAWREVLLNPDLSITLRSALAGDSRG